MSVALVLGVVILFGWGVPKIALAALLIIGILIWAIAWRQNWARWTLAAVTVISFAFTFEIIRFQMTYGILLPLATAAQFVLEIVGFYLLFRPAAARWYRREPNGDA